MRKNMQDRGSEATPPADLLLKNQICFSLYSASRFLIQAYQDILKPLDLTYLQYLTLMVLWEKKQLSVSQLGELLFLDSGTLSPLLKKLEQKQLLTRERSPEDERTVLVRLTEAGQQLQKQAINIPTDLFCLTQSSMTDLKRLKKDLDQLSVRLRKTAGPNRD